MRSFNRHDGGFYEHYQVDKEKDYPNEVLNYMLANPGAHTIDLGTPMPQDVTMAPTGTTMESSSSGTMTSTTGVVLPGDQRAAQEEQVLPPGPPEDTEGGIYTKWIPLDYEQAKHFQAWCIPKELWRDHEQKLTKDAEVYCDYSSYYREEELLDAEELGEEY